MLKPALSAAPILSNPEIARRSAVAALRVRRAYQKSLTEPFCIFDLLAEAEVDLWFVRAPSLEGMYVNAETPTILVGSERPPGRQRLTAAHEFAHHSFGHGTRVDQLDAPTPATLLHEREADFFASFLLMPKSLVVSAFSKRGWSLKSTTPEQIFTVAGWLGIGYTTLITHLRFSLRLISGRQATLLLGQSVKKVRALTMGFDCLHDGLVIDEHWSGRPIDAAVGDVLRVPRGTVLEGAVGDCADDAGRRVIRLTAPGLARLDNANWASFLRVSERAFAGRARFRHLPREE